MAVFSWLNTDKDWRLLAQSEEKRSGSVFGSNNGAGTSTVESQTLTRQTGTGAGVGQRKEMEEEPPVPASFPAKIKKTHFAFR